VTWHRSDGTIANGIEAGKRSGSGSEPTPPRFVKSAAGNPRARLFASGYIERSQRDCNIVRELVDYHDGHDHIRLVGTSGELLTAGIVKIDGQESVPGRKKFPWPRPSMVEQPSLQLWRRLRDAAESGLRSGESVKINGGYFFERFYSDSVRMTALGAEFKDFDYHMFGRGNGFADYF
jgi:hypothetical protein